MIKININSEEIEVPNSWDEISLREYFRIFNGLEDEKNLLKRECIIVSRLLRKPDAYCESLPLQDYNNIVEELQFIYSDIPESDGIVIEGTSYKVLPKESITTRKFVDIDIISTLDSDDKYDNWLTLLSIILEKDDKEDYQGVESREYLKKELDKLPAYKIIPYLTKVFLLGQRCQVLYNLSLMADQLLKVVESVKNSEYLTPPISG